MRKTAFPRGFTLIELMITISVLAMLMFAVVPSIGEWIRNSQIRSVATSIQAGLQRARSEALHRNTSVQFSLVSLTDSAVLDNTCSPSATGVSWVVSREDPSNSCANTPSATVSPMLVQAHAGGVGGKNATVSARRSDNTAGSSVRFNGFGRVTDSANAIARIEIDNVKPGADYRPLRVVVASGGNILLCEPRITAADDPRKCP